MTAKTDTANEQTSDHAQAAATTDAAYDQITLDYPVERGDQTITTVTLRQPRAGELRGTSLAELIQINVDAVSRVLPRITSPVLTADEIKRLHPADMFQLGSAVAGFLLPKSMRQDADATA